MFAMNPSSFSTRDLSFSQRSESDMHVTMSRLTNQNAGIMASETRNTAERASRYCIPVWEQVQQSQRTARERREKKAAAGCGEDKLL